MPPSWWPGGASWHKYVPLRIHDAKNEQSRPPGDQKISPRHRKTKKSLPGKCPEETQRLIKSARALCEAAKTQGNIIDERRAPPKTGDGPQKKHERSNERHPKGKQRNTPDTGICARSLPPDGGPSSKLYIYIYTNADPCIPCMGMFVSVLSDAGIRGPAQ